MVSLIDQDYHVGSHTHALCSLLSGVAKSGKTPVTATTKH